MGALTDSLSAQALAGTEGAGSLLLLFGPLIVASLDSSPAVKLKKIEASGGPPQTLCDLRRRAAGRGIVME